jgi:arylsulfatase
MTKPNIIFILCDQLRGDAVGADGNTVVQTPNIDALASRGTWFSHAYSASPSCIPARATLWTGQNQWHTGVLGMGHGQGPIPNNFPHTMAGELTREGYRTHLIGKGHFNPHRSLMGFESMELDESGKMPDSDHRVWFAENAPGSVTPDDHGVGWNSWHACSWHTDEYLHPTYWTMSRSLEFLERHGYDRPFFLNISFHRPHSPYDPPKRYSDIYESCDLPKPHIGKWSSMHDDPEIAKLPNAWRGKMTPEQITLARAGYYGSISFIDAQVGRLINWLMENRPEEMANTWFVFTSDHGDMLGDHNLWRKTYAYEGSTRIPFLVVPPESKGKPARPRASEVVELRDIMPTVLDIAGLPLPNTIDGSSVLPLLMNPVGDWRKYIHGEHCTCYSVEQEMQFVTDGIRKFIWFPRIDQEQFFNLDEDPGEKYNLIDEPAYQDEIQEWRGYLTHELDSRDCGWVKDGRPYCPNDGPLVSPFKEVRWTGEYYGLENGTDQSIAVRHGKPRTQK